MSSSCLKPLDLLLGAGRRPLLRALYPFPTEGHSSPHISFPKPLQPATLKARPSGVSSPSAWQPLCLPLLPASGVGDDPHSQIRPLSSSSCSFPFLKPFLGSFPVSPGSAQPPELSSGVLFSRTFRSFALQTRMPTATPGSPARDRANTR